MPKAPEKLREFASLLKVVEFLRGPEGCPWDKEQTHQSLTRFAIEEAHELSEAIDGGKDADMREELGDLLLQVVLHAEIARGDGRFTIADVIETLNEKMIRRHPHVFADVQVKNSDEVIRNWTEIKAAEKKDKGKSHTFDIPKGLPSLIRAQKIGEKTEKLGFDWEATSDVWDKVKEEMAELEAELLKTAESESIDDHEATKLRIQNELGDMFFSLSQLARHLSLDAEQCSRQANSRFEARYKKMRELVESDKKDWEKLSPAEKEGFWQKAKSALR